MLPAEIKLLALLRKGDKYGYEIVREFAAKEENPFSKKEGAIYPLLHALEQDGYLKSYMKDAPTGRRRKYYRITPSGQRYLKKQVKSAEQGGIA